VASPWYQMATDCNDVLSAPIEHVCGVEIFMHNVDISMVPATTHKVHT
jgi:hypothetical protein